MTVILETSADLESLHEWLTRSPELRGLVTVNHAAPKPGELGGVLESLAVALGPGGAATALASVLISWIRRRVGNVRVKVTRNDTSVELDAVHMRDMDTEGLRKLVKEIAEALEPDGGS